MAAKLLKGGFNVPATGVQTNDLLQLHGQIGREKVLVAVRAGPAATKALRR
jgi:hypothetical protein